MARSIDTGWAELFEAVVDVSRDVNHVTAAQIKEITGLEPRLMAKFDTDESRPDAFKEHGYFILPVRNGEYVLIRGQGYHAVEPPSAEPLRFRSRLTYRPKMTELGLSEASKLDLAHSVGLIDEFFGTTESIRTLGGRKYSPDFEFSVGRHGPILVRQVQYEVDAGYEDEHKIVLLEAKIQVPTNTIVRQLYYPYRSLMSALPNITVTTGFLAYEPDDSGGVFHLREYRFADPARYDSIELVQSGSYRVQHPAAAEQEPPLMPAIEELFAAAVTQEWHVPQADDFEKVADIPVAVAMGYTEAKSMARRFSFTERQSSYYRDAAEALGLVSLNAGRYELTDLGSVYAASGLSIRRQILQQLLLRLPVVAAVDALLRRRPTQGLTRQQVADMLEKLTRYNGTTAWRRAATIIAWFRWLGERTGEYQVEDDVLRLTTPLR